jgi:hypothetical protein
LVGLGLGRKIAPVLLLIGALVSPLAAGAEPPLARIALYPVIVPGSEGAELELIQAGVVRMMVEMGYPLVDSEPIHAFLKTKTCSLTEQACLGELARHARGEVSLLMVAAIRGQQVTMYGALVNDEDKLLFAPQNTYPREGKDPQAWVVNAARKFVKTFPFPKEEPIPTLPPPGKNGGSQVQAPPDQPPPPAPPPAAPASVSIPGIASVAGGLAGVGGGVALYLLAQSNRKAMDQYYAGGRLPPPEDVAELRNLSSTIQVQSVLSGIAFGVGALGLGAGAFFFVSDSGAKPEATKSALMVAPGYLGVSVQFP